MTSPTFCVGGPAGGGGAPGVAGPVAMVEAEAYMSCASCVGMAPQRGLVRVCAVNGICRANKIEPAASVRVSVGVGVSVSVRLRLRAGSVVRSWIAQFGCSYHHRLEATQIRPSLAVAGPKEKVFNSISAFLTSFLPLNLLEPRVSMQPR